MAKLPKSIIKKYGITKKAWSVFRGKKKSAKKKSSKKRSIKERVTVMAKRSVGGRARRGARRAVRRARAAALSRPGQIVGTAAKVTAGAVVSSLAVNQIPLVRDQSRTVKSVGQMALGLATIKFSRNGTVRSLGMGSVVAGLMGVVQEVVKMNVLAGPGPGSRTLTSEEMRRITNGMGVPMESMGVPLSGQLAQAPIKGFTGGFGS